MVTRSDQIELTEATEMLSESQTELIQGLIQYGEEQGYLTMDDILDHVPEADANVELLESVFDAIISAGISFSENGFDTAEDEVQAEAKAEGVDIEAERLRLLEAIDAGDSISAYLSQASKVPLLTREEEAELSKRIERGRWASEELANKSVSAEKRKQLQYLIEDGWAAREHLILANMRLVFSVAKKYVGRGLPLMDLVQEGHIGLMRAVKKFDYSRGYKFSTYATWWIRQAVSRSVADNGRTIRIPVHMMDQISKMLRHRQKLTQTLGRDPTPEELADSLDEKISKVMDMLRFAKLPISLETPIGKEEDATFGEFVEDEESPAPEEEATETMLREQVRSVLHELPPREARVLRLRYGLSGERIHTLAEIGDKLNLSRERVRQIEARALRRLRAPGKSHKLREFVSEY
jgi:RNA polymerase primary sigma factor